MSPRDRGLTLGDAIFETVRLYNGHPFRLQEHLDRLRRSAKFMGITVPAQIDAEVHSILAEGVAIDLLHARLRITLTRGEAGSPGLDPATASAPTLILSMDPISAPDRNSVAVVSGVTAQSRRNEFAATAGPKTVQFGDAVIEIARARGMGADECIFLDTHGHLCEGSSSNIFVYDGEVLATPALSCGVLPGITRATIIEIARGFGVSVEERVIDPSELRTSGEVFLTSSVREIVALGSIDGVKIAGAGAEGLTAELARGYWGKVEGEPEGA